jgi:hypothetical protein
MIGIVGGGKSKITRNGMDIACSYALTTCGGALWNVFLVPIHSVSWKAIFDDEVASSISIESIHSGAIGLDIMNY